jgi:hypothetical protein
MIDNPMIRAQEQADNLNAEYSDWVENNADWLLEEWFDTLSYSDMPQAIQDGITTDDVDDWRAQFELWIDTLKIDDVPNDWLSDKYDDCEGGNIDTNPDGDE